MMAELIYTPSQTVGPFYGTGLLWAGCTETVAADDPEAVAIRGVLADGEGPFVYPEGVIELWGGDQFVRAQTNEDGRYQVTLRRTISAPALLDGRSQAPHLNVAVFGRGLLKPLLTRMYFPDEMTPNAVDPVLELVPAERRSRLIAIAEPDGSLCFDICVQGPNEGVFFSL